MTMKTQRAVCDDWLKHLNDSQRFAVALAESTYDITDIELMEWIHGGLLRWKRVRDASEGWSADRQSYTPGRYWWCLVES